MGRAPNPIPSPDSTVGRLAEFLRAGLGTVGLTFRELADKVVYDATTLQRAADGKTVASWNVVREFAKACELNEERALRLWRAARSERDGKPLPSRSAPVAVEQIATYADLGLYLSWVRNRSGTSYQRIEDRASAARRQFGRLPHSTAHRIGSRKTNRPSLFQVQAFLVGCGIQADEHGPVVRAWHRAERRYWDELGQGETAGRPAILPRAPEEEHVSPVQLAQAMGYSPIEAYRGRGKPWSVRCVTCGRVQRIQLRPPEASRSQGCKACTPAQADDTGG